MMTGYASLLNVEAQPHWTIFLTDFALRPTERRRIQRQLRAVDTRLRFVRVNRGLNDVIRQMSAGGIDPHRDYVSLQTIISRDSHLALVEELFDRLPRRDMARVDVPTVASGFQPARASRLLSIVMRSDFAEQEEVARRFFNLLAEHDPYEVVVRTRGGELRIRDSRGWFELAGKLRPDEMRSLPGGEVAHSGGGDIEGDFVVDGAILPVAQHRRFAGEALRLMRLSRQLRRYPFRLHVRGGKVVGVTGKGRPPGTIARLLESNERYCHVNEVGIAFNRASARFIHAWPSASNEVRPGVHVGIGGAANPDDEDPQRSRLIHLDCMAANCEVFVNGRPFLRASS
jgi:hypothetical protein